MKRMNRNTGLDGHDFLNPVVLSDAKNALHAGVTTGSARSFDAYRVSMLAQREVVRCSCKLLAVAVAFMVSFVPHTLDAQTPAFDLVITNGHIIDGTGSPWYSGDLGIREGRIAAIGNLHDAPRKQTIDAHGQVVAPGFIDMLGQSEMTM